MVERSRHLAVAVFGASADVEDLRVNETLGDVVRDDGGRALELSGGDVHVNRASLARSREVSLYLRDGSEAEMRDLRVADSSARGCARSTCMDAPFGRGMTVTEQAYATIESFEFVDGDECGIYLADGEVDLRLGRIANFPIGVCLSSSSFDVGRLEDQVVYEGNEVPVRGITLPVPTATAPLEQLLPEAS
jgi:hypothetical protein